MKCRRRGIAACARRGALPQMLLTLAQRAVGGSPPRSSAGSVSTGFSCSLTQCGLLVAAMQTLMYLGFEEPHLVAAALEDGAKLAREAGDQRRESGRLFQILHGELGPLAPALALRTQRRLATGVTDPAVCCSKTQSEPYACEVCFVTRCMQK